ncbi:MAG: helix-turn-helix transcriptional regulator [Streptosporangiaceae bacterium]|jgi:transcriptional regulator with XRE-family HTH domain
MTGANPTVRQRELGMQLRRLRTDRGLTVEEVADRLLCSATKISRMETGARRPSLRDVRDLSELYEIDVSAAEDLMALARQARELGWWKQYDDLRLDPFIGLEQDASAITNFTMFYVPALIQTEDYARAIIKAIAPRIDPKILEQRVEVRMRRQELLERDNHPRYRVLVDESVLHRPAGGHQVMAAQLTKVLKYAKDDKAAVQVVPFDIGVPAISDSNFVLLDFDDPVLSSVVFVEGLTSNQIFEKRSDLDRYREAVEHLRDSALSPRDSVTRITDAQKTYIDG